MGDAESDEHLRLFKCLVDTGADVLRDTVERKMLTNTSFEQYLNQNKHKFYHQFEKRRYKPCCSGNRHNCVVDGKMDKKIFFKMYNKMAKLDIQYCLDRFVVNTDISVDKLDLSDLNFFLWNSATLSTQEEQSLQSIMSTRSTICHSSSSRKYSLKELDNFWISLKNDLLLFAEPYRYKKSIEREITTLMNCSLGKTESKKIIDEMKTLFHELKLETDAKNKSMENQTKKGNEGLEECFRLENNSIKTHINEKMHEILENCERGSRTMKRCKTRIKAKVQREGMKTRLQSKRNRNFLDTKLSDSERTICQKVKSNKRRMNKMLELTQEGMIQNSKRFKSMQTQQTENNNKHQLTTIECKDEIKAKVKREGRKTRLHNEDQNKSFHQKLTETDMRIDKRVAQSQTQLSTKMEEEAHETRRQFKTGFKILLGVLGKQNITLGINQDQIEQLIESSDAGDIYTTSKYDQQCLTEEKEINVIKYLQSEIPIPPSNDINSDPSDKQAFQVIVKKVNSIILKLKATPGIFKSVETLKSALLTLVKHVHIAGKIDAEIEDTITIDLSFDSPLTKDQISVVKCMFSKEWNDENNDKTLSKEHTSSAKAKIESYPEHETSSQQAVTRPLCQACAEKDKQIKAYEEKTREHENSIKFYKLQDSSSKKALYECRNCYEMEVIIIQLDRRLCEIRRHIIAAKKQSLLMYYIRVNNVFDDLLKITDQNTSITSSEEKGRLKDKTLKSNRSSQDSKLISDVDVRDSEKKAKRKLMESQASQGRRPELDQTEEKSDFSLRISEIRHEYASSLYTKTDKQNGLGIIVQQRRSRYPYNDTVSDYDSSYLQEFFEEMDFVVKCTEHIDTIKLLKYMTDGKYYCIFIVIIGNRNIDDSPRSIQHLLSQRSIGKPVIIMTDSTFHYCGIREEENNEINEILIVKPLNHIDTGPYDHSEAIFDDFLKTTRRNRFADLIDILTRMNALYGYPIITFQSSLTKKFCFYNPTPTIATEH